MPNRQEKRLRVGLISPSRKGSLKRDFSQPMIIGEGFRFVLLTLNTILIILLLRFVYPIAFRALLNVFVIRIPIGRH